MFEGDTSTATKGNGVTEPNQDETPTEKSDWKKIEDGTFEGFRKILTWGCFAMMAVLGIMALAGKLTIM